MRGADFLGQTAVLELDSFPVLHHVTLRWDPADSLLRREVEGELAHHLKETAAPETDLGAWLTLLGLFLLALTFLGAFLLLLLHFLAR